MARQRPPEDSESGGSWMDTYGDMVTLLLTFFVLLFSFSNVDAKKWEELVLSFSRKPIVAIEGGTSGIVPNMDSLADVPFDLDYIANENAETDADAQDALQTFNHLYEAMKAHISAIGLEDRVAVDLINENQILLRMGERALFDSGYAVIKSESVELLDDMCATIAQFDAQIAQIVVEGHTDSDPIVHGVFKSNRRLSNERALQVVEYIEAHTNIDEKKLSSTGKGENWPIAPNDNAENKAKNRRVDIIIYNADQ